MSSVRSDVVVNSDTRSIHLSVSAASLVMYTCFSFANRTEKEFGEFIEMSNTSLTTNRGFLDRSLAHFFNINSNDRSECVDRSEGGRLELSSSSSSFLDGALSGSSTASSKSSSSSSSLDRNGKRRASCVCVCVCKYIVNEKVRVSSILFYRVELDCQMDNDRVVL